MTTLPTRPATSALDAFISRARPIAPSTAPRKGRGRLVFALDATSSRKPTWDLACRLQGEMFAAADGIAGGLAVKLAYFRGFDECRASRWVVAPSELTTLMTQIDCRGGLTQIGRVLRHAVKEAESAAGLAALVYVGDAMEEPVDHVCARAGELGRLGVKCFTFLEGNEAAAESAFKEIARLSGGAFARFDAGAPETLASLLRAAAAYASGGVEALDRLASREPQAHALLTSMKP